MGSLLAQAGDSHGIATPLSLILISAAAFVIPLVSRRLGLPAVVLEILTGVIVGPMLGIIEPGEELLSFLAEFGLFLLMFLAGLEIDFDRLERQGPRQLVSSFALFAFIAAASFFAAGFFGLDNLEQRVFLTLLISASALGIVVPALRAGNHSSSQVGQVTLITAMFAEVLTVVAIVVLVVLVEDGFGWELLAVPALFATLAIVLFVLRRAAWWYPDRFERMFDGSDPEEMGIRGSLAMLFVFVGLSALLGIEAILGAFLAGLVFGYVFRDPGSLDEQLSGFSYGFLIPIFFINVGITFPLSELGDSEVLGRALALIGVAFAVKLIPSLLLVLRRFSLRQAVGAGFLLAGQLSVIIALAGVGVDLGLLTEGLAAGAVLLVAVSAIASPIVFRLLVPDKVEESV
ncbi:MAG: cation:proton antiporter [Acidimicrobiia bacterium]|nr:cation:proton antiporter [Acidimicrobiia bacterium]MDH3470736.1 cation:proton antiporter [Acidimicrobiia bacterium]